MRHLMNALDLTVDEIHDLIVLAEKIIQDPARFSEVCKGKKLATCFYEPSTRTHEKPEHRRHQAEARRDHHRRDSRRADRRERRRQ